MVYSKKNSKSRVARMLEPAEQKIIFGVTLLRCRYKFYLACTARKLKIVRIWGTRKRYGTSEVRSTTRSTKIISLDFGRLSWQPWWYLLQKWMKIVQTFFTATLMKLSFHRYIICSIYRQTQLYTSFLHVMMTTLIMVLRCQALVPVDVISGYGHNTLEYTR